MIGNYIVVEYSHGKGNISKSTEPGIAVHYVYDTDELYSILDEIAAKNSIPEINNETIHGLRDVVDVHIIEDMYWEDEYVMSRSNITE